jgi:hypothetical protein
MKAILTISAVAVFLLIPTRCFALWEIAEVTKEEAKKMGLEVRWNPAGPDDVRVEMEFKVEGVLKDFDRVDLHLGDGGKSLVTASLKEDRSKEGRAVVSFSADRAQLDKIRLSIMIPGGRGGVIYEVRVKDFVELKKER